jgi:hypothetical protein
MRLFFASLTAFALSALPAAAQLDGSFTLRRADDGNRFHLNLLYADGGSNYGGTFERSDFSDVVQKGDRVSFVLRRAPGAMTFEGRGTIDRASGWYDFAPNAEFLRDMERLGFRAIEDSALFVFAMDDLTVLKAKQLQGLVSDTLDTEQLVRLINHGAGLRYVQSMTDLGIKKLSSDEYRRARDHGVSARYVKELSELGFKLSIDELVRARDHGVSADFLTRMNALGYKGLDLQQYVRLRDHGVTPDYAESVGDAGLGKLSADDLVRLRDHGVSAEYIRRMKGLFKETPTVDQIIRLRTRREFGR